MNRIFRSVKETMFGSQSRNEERDLLHGGETNIFQYLMANESEMTVKEAMKIPAVSASVDLVASTIGRIPINLMQPKEDEEIVKVVADDYDRLVRLNMESNETLNAYNFKKQVVKDYLFHGASYVKVDKDSTGRVTGLYPLDQENLTIKKMKHKNKSYVTTAEFVYTYSCGATDVFHMDEVLVILKDSKDGITSSGVLENNADILSLALNEIKYSGNLLKNGALPLGLLKTATPLSTPAIERLRDNWNTLYTGAENSGKTLILEEGLDYSAVSLNPNELDLTNSKKSTMSEIARIFNVPESMINSDANKYASNEMNNIHFLQYCITPIIDSVESAINRTLLREDEKRNGLHFAFDKDQIIKTTEKDKMETVSVGVNNGLITINEGRQQLGKSSVYNGDVLRGGLGDTLIDTETGDITIANLGITINPKDDALETSDMQKLKELVDIVEKVELIEKLKAMDNKEVTMDDADKITEQISKMAEESKIENQTGKDSDLKKKSKPDEVNRYDSKDQK